MYNSLEIISFHCMENILKKSHSSIISQFNAIQVIDNPSQEIHLNLQLVLTKNLMYLKHHMDYNLHMVRMIMEFH